jgi:hypothetical protein
MNTCNLPKTAIPIHSLENTDDECRNIISDIGDIKQEFSKFAVFDVGVNVSSRSEN